MKARNLIGFLCLALALSCSRAVEPGLYTAQGGYVRVFLDSLGNKKAVMYRDTSALWADTLTFDLKAQEKTLKPYKAPEFHLFPERELYREPAFKVGEAHDIVYGRVVKNADDDHERMDLTLDVYVPEDGARTARPLLVAFHDGAFLNGDKRDSSLVEWCRYFASLGYVVSSVDYRQGYRRNEKETDEAMYHALKDANAAVRFLLKRDSLLIHSERIFASGADAGAITAMNLAFMREENMPVVMTEQGDSLVVTRQQLLRGFDVRAVANLWGAVPDTAILRNAKTDKKLSQGIMPGIYLLGYLHSLFGNGYIIVLIHCYITFFSQAFCRICYTRLCYAKLAGYINRSDFAVLFLYYQHSFKIIFGCLF